MVLARSACDPKEIRVSDTPVKIGALVWNQYTDWPAMLRVARQAETLGYDSLWT